MAYNSTLELKDLPSVSLVWVFAFCWRDMALCSEIIRQVSRSAARTWAGYGFKQMEGHFCFVRRPRHSVDVPFACRLNVRIVTPYVGAPAVGVKPFANARSF